MTAMHYPMLPPPVYARLDARVIWEGKTKAIQIMAQEQIDTDEALATAYAPIANLTSKEARHLGYMLLGLASEADVQQGYLLALRSHKTTEEEIMQIVNDATNIVVAARAEQR